MRRFGATLVALLLASVALGAQNPVTLQTVVGAGSIAVNGGTVVLAIPSGRALRTLGVESAGTWSGTIQVECAASSGGSGSFVALELTPRNSSSVVTSFTGNGQWRADIGGCQRVQARATASITGSALISLVGAPM